MPLVSEVGAVLWKDLLLTYVVYANFRNYRSPVGIRELMSKQ